MGHCLKKYSFILLLIILIIAAFFRFWKLAEIPPGLYPDVAINGNDALEALKTGDFKLFYPENNGREGLFINIIALVFAIFGPSVWAIKMTAAVFGTLTVLGLYLLTRQLFKYLDSENPKAHIIDPKQIPNPNNQISNRFGIWNLGFGISSGEKIALFSALFLATSFWHVNFSRLGFRAIMVPFFLVWSFYFLFKGIHDTNTRIYTNDTNKKNKLFTIGYWVMAGIFFGLGFHTYIAFRVAPLILVPPLLIEIIRYWSIFKERILIFSSKWRALKESYIKDSWYRWDIFFVAIIIAALPMIIYYFQHPADFIGRAGQVSVFSSSSPLKTLAVSTIKTLGQFVVWGDGNWRHNISGSPEIFWPLIPFFIIGLFYSVRQIFKKNNYRRKNWPHLSAFWTLCVWWGAMLLPSIMTSEGLPHALRTIGAIPPSYIFTAVGFWLVMVKLKNQISKIKILNFTLRKATWLPRIFTLSFYILIFAFCIILVGAEYYRYFIYWGQNPEVKGSFTQKFVDEANYLNSLPQNVKKYVVVNENGVPVPYPDGIPMPAQTIMFLTGAKNPDVKITYLKTDDLLKEENCVCEQIAADSLTGSIVVLPMADDAKIFNHLKDEIPGGRVENQGEFSVFKIN